MHHRLHVSQLFAAAAPCANAAAIAPVEGSLIAGFLDAAQKASSMPAESFGLALGVEIETAVRYGVLLTRTKFLVADQIKNGETRGV